MSFPFPRNGRIATVSVERARNRKATVFDRQRASTDARNTPRLSWTVGQARLYLSERPTVAFEQHQCTTQKKHGHHGTSGTFRTSAMGFVVLPLRTASSPEAAHIVMIVLLMISGAPQFGAGQLLTTVTARSEAARRSKHRKSFRRRMDYSLRSPCGPACGSSMCYAHPCHATLNRWQPYQGGGAAHVSIQHGHSPERLDPTFVVID